jgi:hypothetical protein
LVFLLLHSLRWNEMDHRGAEAVRASMAVAWVIQSFVWVNSEHSSFWMPFVPGVIVLAAYVVYHIRHGFWDSLIVPVSAILVVLSGPCSVAVDGVRTAPVGLLAVAGSFLLLGLGTVAALTRHLWHKHEHEEAGPSAQRNGFE